MFDDAQLLAKKGITKQRSSFPILSFYRGHERQVGNVTHDFIKSLEWADRYLIKVPNATHGEFCDDPYLMQQMNFEWPRKQFNTLEESLKIYYSVIKISKLFFDSILLSEHSSDALHKKIQAESKKRKLIYIDKFN